MVFISVTRLRLRSPLYLPAFLWNNLLTSWQVINTPGFLGGKLLGDAKRTFWTMTAWEEQAAMKIYRNSDAHRSVMPSLKDWCDEASVVHWQQDNSNLPNWIDAHRRMVADGFFTRVSNPSPAQLERNISEPASTRSLLLRPRRTNPQQ